MLKERLRILVVGNGGREHALAWKLSQSKHVDSIFVVPGNGGTANVISNIINIPDVKVDDYASMVSLAKEHGINLVVPGPEAPLVDGIHGYFQAVGIRCFGPSKAAARMEGSKTFSKDFMSRHNIPTAHYQNFSKYEDAAKYLDFVSHDVVIKASGLAAGKGVILPASKGEAHQALKEIMLERQFGEAGDEIVIEELLEGDELSVLTFSDGYTIKSLPPAQDHKRVFDDDKGPNTGGMGCYAPTRIASKEVIEEIARDIIQPSIDGMRKEGFPFVGMLFTGLMMTKLGPRVLEYNVRGGDPETQTLLPLLSPESDLAEIMVACTEHWLDGLEVKIEDKYAATVVASAKGYPSSYQKGTPITFDKSKKDTLIFHAGTTLGGDTLKTSGGRVIAATATASTLEDAIKRAYEGMNTIHFDGMHYRKDIAHRAFKHAPRASEPLTYASAGVSITAGNDLVSLIKPLVASTSRPGSDAVIGGYGGTFSLPAAGYSASSPILIGAIDGVGTKLKVAYAMETHDTVGIDLVAMNANDLVVQGAECLFFLDCYSCSALDLSVAASFIKGVAEGCKQANCALVGGETAEMPGLFAAGTTEYDAVGAAVGALPARARILPDVASMREGDVLLGMASSGVHSNGFSLIRKIVKKQGMTYQDPAPWEHDKNVTVGASLLTPTRIYVKSLLSVIRKHNTDPQSSVVKGLSHITGGGLLENVPRMLPKHLRAEIDAESWEMPTVFRWMKKTGNVAKEEMARTFNCGVGMVVVVGIERAEEVQKDLVGQGEQVFRIGRLSKLDEEGGEQCILSNIESWDRD